MQIEDFDKALDFHRRHIVIDGHADSIMMVLEGKRRLAERSNLGHIDFPRALEAGLTCTVQAIFVHQERYPMAAARALVMLEALLQEIEAASETVLLVKRAGDIRRAKAEGKLGVLLNLEGGAPLHGELSVLRTLHRLGLRMMQPVWNFRTELASGADDEASGGGLTKLGREWVREMNRLGMVIDLSHITAPGFYHVLEESKHPILFTHGCCRSLHDHPRNLTDDQIKALAQNGGVIGITFVDSFLGPKPAESDYKSVADHIDHAVNLVGPRHVAVGSDFDGCSPARGLTNVDELPNLTAELLHRGYKEEDLALILGGNFLRVFEQVMGS